RVQGCGCDGFKSPAAPVDFGNAGTGVRLVMGAASGFHIQVRYVGDASLSARPMGRILQPLGEMGAKFQSNDGKLPVQQTKGGHLQGQSFTPKHASAQIKSAILLAGLQANGVTEVVEKTLTRDHTENMLRAFGVTIDQTPTGQGQKVRLHGPATLSATDIDVPGDPSSAAFLVASALMVPGSSLVVENVMMNPTRTGLFQVLQTMGAELEIKNPRRSGGEDIADIHVRYSQLQAVTTNPDIVPSMIDEFPVLAVLCARAQGTSRLRGLGELRVKESDRLEGTRNLLVRNGVAANIDGDDLVIRGGVVLGGATVPTLHDHRLAMSALVLGLASHEPIAIDDTRMINTSFPTFFKLMDKIGVRMEIHQ
ncbi:MAG TPA: 3-phosphoshikimate 1-carboxyvinyltransferase, partial [Hellea balneolensis]|nr:3-phosphoshikimate 1-carboxyvinyltransferase [Hellea balneolensis]